LYGAEIWTLWKIDQKYLEGFEIWCWRRMEKIGWDDCVKNKEVLKQPRRKTKNILRIIKQRKSD
jgi:hypothetical protein